MRPAVLDDEVCSGIGKHVVVPWNEKIAGLYNLVIDVNNVQLFHGVVEHLTGGDAAGQAQYHYFFGIFVKQHGEMSRQRLGFHVSP